MQSINHQCIVIVGSFRGGMSFPTHAELIIPLINSNLMRLISISGPNKALKCRPPLHHHQSHRVEPQQPPPHLFCWMWSQLKSKSSSCQSRIAHTLLHAHEISDWLTDFLLWFQRRWLGGNKERKVPHLSGFRYACKQKFQPPRYSRSKSVAVIWGTLASWRAEPIVLTKLEGAMESSRDDCDTGYRSKFRLI